jgi:hypothetical protein
MVYAKGRRRTMSTLKISDIPTFAEWISESTTPDDNMLNDYINGLQENISGLVAIEDFLSPCKGEEPSEDYTNINMCCRQLALLVSDLKAIRREVHTAGLLNETGLKPRKGGEK